MSATRAELVDAATDLNNVVLAPDDPIDVTLSVSEIRKDLKEAAKFVRPEDALQEATRRVLAEVAGASPPEGTAVGEEAEDAEEEAQPEAGAASAEPKQAAGNPVARPRGRPRKDASAPASAAPKRGKKAATAKEPGKAKETKTQSSRQYVLGVFKPVRAGTKYQELLEKATSGEKVEAIASGYGVRRVDVLWYFRYPLRKHGIDHVVEKDDTIRLVLPSGKTVADCVEQKAA